MENQPGQALLCACGGVSVRLCARHINPFILSVDIQQQHTPRVQPMMSCLWVRCLYDPGTGFRWVETTD